MEKEKVEQLENLRCQCGKIVCQLDEKIVVIKCRHCKRFIVINTKGIETTSGGEKKVQYLS
ncbi:MAG: hypothetical protein H0Z35_00270 [Thermoanaerobacteraceae bacterium]|nr:hypothetical protein [Thermoanaerobacteraceae bacterium]